MSTILQALALYRSMVLGGEAESPDSLKMFRAAQEEHRKADQNASAMLYHINPKKPCDGLNGKLSQISDWLASTSPERHDMRSEFQETINRHSAENGSDTPDHILAEYLTGCLAAWDRALQARERHYGRSINPPTGPWPPCAGDPPLLPEEPQPPAEKL